MKLINRDTDYAMRALTYLAQSKDQVVAVSQIAQQLSAPRPFLRKILQILQQEGLLKSYEGRQGGFSLAQAPEKIFLSDLINIFQGPMQFSDCLFQKRICPDQRTCLLRKKISDLEQQVFRELGSVNIASLI